MHKKTPQNHLSVPVSTIVSIAVFVVATATWYQGSLTMNEQLDTQSSLRDEVDRRFSLEVMSFDQPDRAILKTDRDGIVTWANDCAKDFWGWPEGMNVHQTVPPECRMRHVTDFGRGVEKASQEHLRVVHAIECETADKDGNIHDVRVKIFAIAAEFIVFVDRIGSS